MKLIDMKLSPHFTMKEACTSKSKAAQADILLYTTAAIAINATRLANEVLEPLRMVLDDTPITVNSWIRTPKINVAVSGSKGSQHLDGLAVDFYHPEMRTAYDALAHLEVGQRIIYLDAKENPLWVHASMPGLDWEWWEGKKSWKKPDGSFVLQSLVCYPNETPKRYIPFTGRATPVLSAQRGLVQ